MAINKNSNSYTIGFAVVLVIVVGAALSFASISLKPRQVKNQVDKKMISILNSINIEADRANASEIFYEFVKERIVLNYEGEVIQKFEGEIDPNNFGDPFNIDVQKEYRDPDIGPTDRNYPIYLVEKDGERLVVIPMVGKGLWGPIWGYIALQDDYNTVYGAVFNHSGETPGLGAEIAEPFFQEPFQDKTIYDDQGELVSITVRKGGAQEGNNHQVDAITGGTITSNGVTEMLQRTLAIYDKYFQTAKAEFNS